MRRARRKLADGCRAHRASFFLRRARPGRDIYACNVAGLERRDIVLGSGVILEFVRGSSFSLEA